MTSKSNLECDHFDVCHIVHTRKDHKCPSDPQNKSCDYDTRSSKSPAATIAWAIKAPDGELCLSTLRDNEASAKYAARNICNMDDNKFSWAYIEKEGYRCVRVTVQECKE